MGRIRARVNLNVPRDPLATKAPKFLIVRTAQSPRPEELLTTTPNFNSRYIMLRRIVAGDQSPTLQNTAFIT